MNITKRKDGRYMGRFAIGRNETGKPVYQYVYGSTYAEAEEKLRIGMEIETRYLSGRCVTVAEVCQEWLRAVTLRVKASTLANYRVKLEKHILPELGGISCSKLTSGIVNGFIQKKLAEGLSASYVRDIFVVFKTMLKYAQSEYGFTVPLANVTLPKCERKPEEKISSAEQKALVSYLKVHMGLTSFGILISLFMGLRIGELCGLQWGDVDFANHVLHIHRTVQRISVTGEATRTKLMISTPKSRSSARSIAIPDFLMPFFEQLRSEDNCFILSGTEKPIEPRTMQYRYTKILNAAKTKHHRFHKLRHTFATNCMQNGFDAKTLSVILGHSSITMTLSRYVHPDIGHTRSLMNRMRTLF